MIPCLGLGPELIEPGQRESEITGLCFHKIDEGVIKPILPQNVFSPFNWPNAPTREDPRLDAIDLPEAPDPVPEEWVTFRDMTQRVAEALIALVSYCQISYIRHTKSQNVSHLILQFV